MPLPALNWRYVGAQNFVSGIANSHDAVYTLGTAATYADGTARTPGTGSAWTWLRDQTGTGGSTISVYGAPPTNPLNFRYILGGAPTGTAYTMAAPDTGSSAANTVVVGMNRNAGAYTTWTSTTPFTTASSFSQYWFATRSFATVAYDTVAMWESQEGCVIQYGLISTGATSTAKFGALIDPLTYTVGTTCETDQRLYVFYGSGANTTTSNTWQQFQDTDSILFGGLGTIASAHATAFTPGTNSLITGVQSLAKMYANTNSSTFVALNGDIPRIPLYASFRNAAGNNFIGQWRDVAVIRNAISRQVLSVGGVPNGYVLGANLNSAQHAALLLY